MKNANLTEILTQHKNKSEKYLDALLRTLSVEGVHEFDKMIFESGGSKSNLDEERLIVADYAYYAAKFLDNSCYRIERDRLRITAKAFVHDARFTKKTAMEKTSEIDLIRRINVGLAVLALLCNEKCMHGVNRLLDYYDVSTAPLSTNFNHIGINNAIINLAKLPTDIIESVDISPDLKVDFIMSLYCGELPREAVTRDMDRDLFYTLYHHRDIIKYKYAEHCNRFWHDKLWDENLESLNMPKITD